MVSIYLPQKIRTRLRGAIPWLEIALCLKLHQNQLFAQFRILFEFPDCYKKKDSNKTVNMYFIDRNM